MPPYWGQVGPLGENPKANISGRIQQELNALCPSPKPNNTMFGGLDVNLLVFLHQAGVFSTHFRLPLWIYFLRQEVADMLVMDWATTQKLRGKVSMAAPNIQKYPNTLTLLKGHSTDSKHPGQCTEF